MEFGIELAVLVLACQLISLGAAVAVSRAIHDAYRNKGQPGWTMPALWATFLGFIAATTFVVSYFPN